MPTPTSTPKKVPETFPPSAVLTYAEAAGPLGVSERQVRRWVSEGRLACIQLPRGRRLRGSTLNRWLADRESE